MKVKDARPLSIKKLDSDQLCPAFEKCNALGNVVLCLLELFKDFALPGELHLVTLVVRFKHDEAAVWIKRVVAADVVVIIGHRLDPLLWKKLVTPF